MSRYKTGLDYFPFDIDFFNDQKIEFVFAKYGIEGEIIAVKMLCRIYRSGYYLKWGEDECLLFSKKVGDNISIELVDNVINELLKRNFFDEKLYKKYQILTSKGIQERYLEATKRRKEVLLFKEYYLLNHINVDSKPENVYIIPLNVDISQQSKGEDSIVKEKIEYIYTHWNSKGITVHKNIEPFIQAIKIALKKYSEEDIKTAIGNYAHIVNGQEYYYDHKYTLNKFLDITAKTNHIEQFLDLEIAKNNYKKGGANGQFTGTHRLQGEPGVDKYKHLEETYEV